MTKASVAVAAPAKPTDAAKAPKAKADGTKQDPHESGTLSREDIANFKLEDDGGSSDAHSDDGNVEENGDLDETKRFVHAPPFGAYSIERNVEARRVGRANSTLARPLFPESSTSTVQHLREEEWLHFLLPPPTRGRVASPGHGD